MNKSLSITKRFTFEASHILNDPKLSLKKNRELFGKCNRMHGHSYKLYVTVTAKKLTRGMVINFRELKRIVNESVIDRLDHYHINDVQGFDKHLPTAENIASSIWRIVDGQLEKNKLSCSLKSINLFETETSSAEIER